jgi:polar amino acid transport system substrate-binding protein
VRRALAVVALGVLSLTGCSGRQVSPPRTPAIRVAMPPDSPPYAFQRGGEVVGLEVDFARELALALGRRVKVTMMPWRDLLPALREHKVDIVMAGLTVTRARQQQIAFGDPYLRSGLIAVMRREDAGRFRDVRSVLDTNEPVGVVAETTGERFVREQVRSAQLSSYTNAQAAIDELRQRRIALAIVDAPVGVYFASADEANLTVLLELLNVEDLAWGFAPGDDDLRADVDAVLARWRSDVTRDRIVGRWLPYWRRLEAGPTGR